MRNRASPKNKKDQAKRDTITSIADQERLLIPLDLSRDLSVHNAAYIHGICEYEGGRQSKAYSFDEEYELLKLDMNKQIISLGRVGNGGDSLLIPKKLQGKIPENAKYELEEFMAYIIKKYGL